MKKEKEEKISLVGRVVLIWPCSDPSNSTLILVTYETHNSAGVPLLSMWSPSHTLGGIVLHCTKQYYERIMSAVPVPFFGQIVSANLFLSSSTSPFGAEKIKKIVDRCHWIITLYENYFAYEVIS